MPSLISLTQVLPCLVDVGPHPRLRGASRARAGTHRRGRIISGEWFLLPCASSCTLQPPDLFPSVNLTTHPQEPRDFETSPFSGRREAFRLHLRLGEPPPNYFLMNRVLALPVLAIPLFPSFFPQRAPSPVTPLLPPRTFADHPPPASSSPPGHLGEFLSPSGRSCALKLAASAIVSCFCPGP